MSRAMPTTISSSGAVPAVKLLLRPRSTGIADLDTDGLAVHRHTAITGNDIIGLAHIGHPACADAGAALHDQMIDIRPRGIEYGRSQYSAAQHNACSAVHLRHGFQVGAVQLHGNELWNRVLRGAHSGISQVERVIDFRSA